MQAMRSDWRFTASAGLPLGGSALLPHDEPAPAPAPARVLRRILVVDDEPDLADLAAALLEAHGFEVETAYSAMTALGILDVDRDIDAVFSDVMMPGMTGFQLGEIMRRLYPAIRLVLTSGFIAPSLMAGQDRLYPCIAKPYRIEAVIEALRRQPGHGA